MTCRQAYLIQKADEDKDKLIEVLKKENELFRGFINEIADHCPCLPCCCPAFKCGNLCDSGKAKEVLG